MTGLHLWMLFLNRIDLFPFRLYRNNSTQPAIRFAGALFLFLLCSHSLIFAQKSAVIHITDNAGQYNNKIEYHLTADSLVITGVADFGRTPVKYISRKLMKSEKRRLKKFLHTFPVDSLDDLYRNEFNPVVYDGKNYYARIMEIKIHTGKQERVYRTENCWVRYSDMIIKTINPMLPAEVKIDYDKAAFNAFY